MIRTFLTASALAALIATGALAQDSSSSSAMDSTMSSSMTDSSAMSSEMSSAMPMDSSSAMTDTSAVSSMEPASPFDITSGYSRVDTDRLATKLIGAPVFDSGAADANNLGNINDLVLDANGKVAAIVIGVGGFLGIGEKQVAVDFAALQWIVAADNTERWTLNATVDQLTAAPDFTTVDDSPDDGTAPSDTSSSSTAM